MRPPLIIWGAEGHAMVVSDIIDMLGEYEVVGHLDDRESHLRPSELAGVPVLGGGEQLHALRAGGIRHLLVAFGHNSARLRKAEEALLHGFQLPTAVHPSAVVARNVVIGSGSVVCANAVINPGSVLGTATIINTGAVVDHESLVGDGAALAPGALMGGRARVGRIAWIGIGATLLDRVDVGENSLIGAGAVVTRNIPPDCVAYGIPARVIRTRNSDE